MNAAIGSLLRPQSIAIFGASADFQKRNGRTLEARHAGVCGKAPVDRNVLERMVSAVCAFGAATAGRLTELDLNPFFCRPGGVIAVDGLLTLSDQPGATGEQGV